MSEEKTYLIVNPKGCMHIVNEEHARARLQIVGWRLATQDEQAAYFATEEQRFDRPIAKPFEPAKDLEVSALPAAPALPVNKPKASKPKAEKPVEATE